jgi:hypothetical protein
MTTTDTASQRFDNNLTFASNAIDQMISMSVMYHVDATNQNSDKSILDQTNNNKSNWSPRFVFLYKANRSFYRPKNCYFAFLDLFINYFRAFRGILLDDYA